jgi:hypothetical protein
MEWVASIQSALHTPLNLVYPALLTLMRTPRLPVVDWTDAPADWNWLIHFAEKRNLVSVHVPSHFNWPLRHTLWVALTQHCRTLVHLASHSAYRISRIFNNIHGSDGYHYNDLSPRTGNFWQPRCQRPPRFVNLLGILAPCCNIICLNKNHILYYNLLQTAILYCYILHSDIYTATIHVCAHLMWPIQFQNLMERWAHQLYYQLMEFDATLFQECVSRKLTFYSEQIFPNRIIIYLLI